MPIRSTAAAFAATLLLAAAPAAHAAITEIAWDAQGGFRHSAPVPPGRFVEVCGKVAVGQRIRWQFETAGPVDFNIHYHVGKDVVYPAKANATAKGADTLTVTVAEDHCWMWTNRGTQAVALSVTLQR